MRIHSKICLLLVAGLLPFMLLAQQPPPGLDGYVDSVLAAFEVPGISLSIVKDGKVIVAKGYGVKKLGEKTPVDARTLFLIASNTKAFTAVALAMLVEEGKLQWDDPVINYLPWFKMADAWVTSQITVRDLLVHRSGIAAYAHDLLIFPPSTYSRKEILMKVKDIPLVHSFRTTYAYDNVLYLAAGEVIKAVSGMEWEDFIQTRILNKIGMKETVARFSSIPGHNNVSSAHMRLHNVVQADDRVFQQAIGDAGDPAGGIASNATDMAAWLITQLDSGRAVNSNRIFKAESAKELWKIVTPIPVGKAPAGLEPSQMDFWGYALGVRCYNYGAYKIVGHGGKLDGFVSQVAFVPKLNLGISVLTNQESTGAYWSIIYHVLDYYMNNKPFDWKAGYKRLLDSSLIEWKRDWKAANFVPDTSKHYALSLQQYAGVYRDAYMGDVTVTLDGTKLHLQFNQSPELTADMLPFQYETFLTTFKNPYLKADAYGTFAIGPGGKVEGLKLKVIDPDSDISFDDLALQKVK